jgi:hypothetical protein
MARKQTAGTIGAHKQRVAGGLVGHQYLLPLIADEIAGNERRQQLG